MCLLTQEHRSVFLHQWPSEVVVGEKRGRDGLFVCLFLSLTYTCTVIRKYTY